MYWASPGSGFNIFPPSGIKDGGEKSKSKDRGFLSFAVNDIAAQKNKEAPNARKHRFWVREMYQKREQLGAFHTLARELRLHDREYFFR